MVFSSLNFIFIFLPLFLFAYYVTPAAFRNSTLFAGSILFYAVGVIKQPYALFLLMVLTYLITVSYTHLTLPTILRV